MTTVQATKSRFSRPATASRHADTLTASVLVNGNRLFHLSRSLNIILRFEGGLCVCEHKPLGILSHAPTAEEAFGAFQHEFIACWDGIARRDDADLTADARSLKKRLLAAVESIQQLS